MSYNSRITMWRTIRNPINWHKQHNKSMTFGEKAADLLRNGMGSWTFVLGFITFLGIWAYLNTTPNFTHWDQYPFILLNLFLSMLAALQGAILLIAAKRADALSAAQAKRDLNTDLAAKAEIEKLMEQHASQMEAIQQLTAMVKDLKAQSLHGSRK